MELISDEIHLCSGRHNYRNNLRIVAYRIYRKNLLFEVEQCILYNCIHYLLNLSFAGYIQWAKRLDNTYGIYNFFIDTQFCWFSYCACSHFSFQQMEHSLFNINVCSLFAEHGFYILVGNIFSCRKFDLDDAVSVSGLRIKHTLCQ